MNPLPKGPRGHVWTNLSSMGDPIATADRWRQEYGDPMTHPGIDGKPLFVTGTAEGIRTIFTAPPELFEPFGVELLEAIIGKGSLLLQSGAQHRAMRRLLMPPFHGQRMRIYGRQMRDITYQLIQALAPGRDFIAQDLMHEISLQVIIQLVFGVTEPERVAEVKKRVSDSRHAISFGLMFPLLLPWLRREFFGVGPWARLQRTTASLEICLGEQIARCRADAGGRHDILSMLIGGRYEDGTMLSEQELFGQLRTLLVAGHSTAAGAMAWALYFLAQEPQIQNRLRAELAALGPEPEPEAMAQVPYLDAVCNEVLRIRPPVGVVGRRLKGPLTILGYELPAGVSVGAHIYWAHTNPKVFTDPTRFDPERFLNRTYSPFEFLPFGGGNRRCIGAAFALYEMKIVLATLVQRFHFELASPRPIRVVQRDILVPSAPIKLIVRAVDGSPAKSGAALLAA